MPSINIITKSPKLGPETQHTPTLRPHIKPFPFLLVLEEFVQTATTALCSARTINQDNKFNRTSELGDMREGEGEDLQTASDQFLQHGRKARAAKTDGKKYSSPFPYLCVTECRE